MSPVTITHPTEEESDAMLATFVYRRRLDISGSVCVSCGKRMTQLDMTRKGYASGRELALCSWCAAEVNTHYNVAWQIKLYGFSHAGVAFASPELYVEIGDIA